jgi:hypothetical protein
MRKWLMHLVLPAARRTRDHLDHTQLLREARYHTAGSRPCQWHAVRWGCLSGKAGGSWEKRLGRTRLLGDERQVLPTREHIDERGLACGPENSTSRKHAARSVARASRQQQRSAAEAAQEIRGLDELMVRLQRAPCCWGPGRRHLPTLERPMTANSGKRGGGQSSSFTQLCSAQAREGAGRGGA